MEPRLGNPVMKFTFLSHQRAMNDNLCTFESCAARFVCGVKSCPLLSVRVQYKIKFYGTKSATELAEAPEEHPCLANGTVLCQSRSLRTHIKQIIKLSNVHSERFFEANAPKGYNLPRQRSLKIFLRVCTTPHNQYFMCQILHICPKTKHKSVENG